MKTRMKRSIKYLLDIAGQLRKTRTRRVNVIYYVRIAIVEYMLDIIHCRWSVYMTMILRIN